ncbi:cellulase family glycosylhydrolase [Spongiactinospora sp. TRM90649]|uniref:cellulase family glycosylhydrolase n=1 Tax=Spongiactinospora sp. TRM90649 TaxID=3031114 RepID=UPI003211A53D
MVHGWKTIGGLGAALILFAAPPAATPRPTPPVTTPEPTPPPAVAAKGLRVAGTEIVESTGAPFVMRGVSHPHAWFRDRTTALADIKSLGANTVRIVLSGGRWPPSDAADVANVVTLCVRQRLICVLEDHDTTGYGEEPDARTLDQAVDFWIGVKSALDGHEDHVIVNIGNEPASATTPISPDWGTAARDAVGRMRRAGFAHALMVDAPGWGQDSAFAMRDGARAVFDADPDRNVVFSIHMYGEFDTAAKINDYLDGFRQAGLPLVIGEFGHLHSDGDPDEDTVMAQARARRLGYLGWSWSGNSAEVGYLDMARDFNAGRLTDWGRRIFKGPDGIAETAREATVYTGDTAPPTAPGTPAVSEVTPTTARLTWTAATDDIGVTGYDVYDGTTLLGSSATESVTLTGLTPDTAYSAHVVARDAANKVSPASPPVAFRTSPAPTPTPRG